MADYIIGLTGGIGSGKTTVSDRFASLGIDIVDADCISRHITSTGQPAVEQIAAHFGSQALSKKSTLELDRAWLRQHIFNDLQAKQWLEGLLHPLISQAITDALHTSPTTYSIFSSPLLLETAQKSIVNRIAIVDIPKDMQIARTLARDHSSPETIAAIIAAQISREERLAMADDIIDNSGDLNATFSQIDKLHNQYLKLAQTHLK